MPNELMPKPEWWPKNPYPESVFPMPRDEYQIIVPDPRTRTALSGMLGRLFWNIASEAIWDAMQDEYIDPVRELVEACDKMGLADPLLLHLIADVRPLIGK